jgi:RNA polymerase sigma-70 factor (ECF subfamily)
MAFDERAWDEALARFRPLLLCVARQQLNARLWRRVDPSDIVQKTLFEAHRRREAFRGSTEAEFEAWLRVILRHLVIDEARRLKCRKNRLDREVPVPEIPDRSKSPSGRLGRYEEALRFARALEKLPELQRRAIELHHLQGRPLAETAAALQRSKAAVASLLHRAQIRLRELLKKGR